jgi:hypothetical protein
MATSTYVAGSRSTSTLHGLYRRARGGDGVSYLITLISAVGILLVVALIVIELWANSQPRIATFGWHFLDHV